MRTRTTRLLCAYLCAAISLPNPVIRVGSRSVAASPVTETSLADQLEQVLDAFEAEARTLPRDTFDPQAVVEKVGRDTASLFAFVRDSTWWVPYQGSLRGSTGVLMDRVGNSLDRALCLATILRTAGHEARLARGTLAEARARELLKAMPPLPDGRVPVRHIETSEVASSDHAKLAQDVTTRVVEQTTSLRTLLGDMPAATNSTETWRLLADHWWVQVMDNDGGWLDLDPLRRDAQPGERLAEATAIVVYGDSGFPVARDDQHRLEVVVRIESLVGGKLTENVALRQEFVPSELQGQPIAMWFHPMDWPDDAKLVRDAEPMRRFKEACLAQQEWLPVLRIGSKQIMQSAFKRDGSLDEKPVVDPMKRLGGGVGKALEGAREALGGFGEDTPRSGELTAVVIEYAIHAPGRAPELHRRTTFDLLGTRRTDTAGLATFTVDDAQQLTRALALRTKTNLLPLCCQPSPESVIATAAEQTHANRASIRAAAAAADDSDTMKFATALQQLRPVPGMLPMLALARTLLSPVGQDVYVDRLQLLCEEAGFAPTPDGSVRARATFDIVANRFAVRAGSDGFATAFEQGVVDTTVEAMLRDRTAPTENTGELLAVSRSQGIEWRRIAKPEDLAGLAIDGEMRAAIASELSAGQVLLVPERAVELGGKQLFGWWRIDPVSGQTLGIMNTGRGQAMAEYTVILLVGVLAFFGCAGATPGKNSAGKNLACLGCAAAAAFAAAVVLEVIAASTLGAGLAGKAGIPVFGACNAISAAAS